MKNISFETHPILKLFSKSFSLTDTLNIELLLNTSSEIAKSISIHLENKEQYLNNLDIVSFTAIDKVSELTHTFRESGLIKDFFSSEEEIKGICILNNAVLIYHFEGVNKGNDIAKILFTYSIENKLYIYSSPLDDIHYSSLESNDVLLLFSFLINFCVFKKYAPVESKLFTSSLKHKKTETNRFNKLPFNLNHVDITWFTTLIKTGEFSVSGHWRLQPYKDGKKLIWIKNFKKSGYTKVAKILK